MARIFLVKTDQQLFICLMMFSQPSIEITRLFEKGWLHYRRLDRRFFGRKAFAAATFARHARIFEDELLIQALADEVDFGAVHLRQAVRVDQNLNTVLQKHQIIRLSVFRHINDIRPTGTATFLDPETQTYGAWRLGLIFANPG